jgi:hypothetical protein
MHDCASQGPLFGELVNYGAVVILNIKNNNNDINGKQSTCTDVHVYIISTEILASTVL